MLFQNIKHIIKEYFHILIIDVAFILFFILNNFSLVLGDRQSHKMTLHLAQVNHFLFAFLFFFPMVNFKIFRLFYKDFYSMRNLTRFIVFFIMVYCLLLMCDGYSQIHDFILSDNRHYSFYYIRKVYMDSFIKNILLIWTSVIVSLVLIDNSSLLIDNNLNAVVICVLLILVPAKLLEFRYFNLCFITFLTIIHYNSPKWKDLYYFIFNKYNVIWSIIINSIVLYNFIQKPFSNSYFGGEISRFMW